MFLESTKKNKETVTRKKNDKIEKCHLTFLFLKIFQTEIV